jgi:hypothetical protein
VKESGRITLAVNYKKPDGNLHAAGVALFRQDKASNWSYKLIAAGFVATDVKASANEAHMLALLALAVCEWSASQGHDYAIENTNELVLPMAIALWPLLFGSAVTALALRGAIDGRTVENKLIISHRWCDFVPIRKTQKILDENERATLEATFDDVAEQPGHVQSLVFQAIDLGLLCVGRRT